MRRQFGPPKVDRFFQDAQQPIPEMCEEWESAWQKAKKKLGSNHQTLNIKLARRCLITLINAHYRYQITYNKPRAYSHFKNMIFTQSAPKAVIEGELLDQEAYYKILTTYLSKLEMGA